MDLIKIMLDYPIALKELSLKEARKATGSHYTPKILADFVAQQILSVWKTKSQTDYIYILDPAVGDGELLNSILEQLSGRGYRKIKVFGFETNKEAVLFASTRLEKAFPEYNINIKCEDFVEYVYRKYNNNAKLRLSFSPDHFDIVIANPPYVRTQVMGAKQAQMLSQKFGLSGRVDLYHAFILGIERVLKPGGIVGIIVSNRFMMTKSGESIRKAINNTFDIYHVWDLGDTKLFEAAVLPAVLLLRKKRNCASVIKALFTSIYSYGNHLISKEIQCDNVIEALSQKGIVRLSDGRSYIVKQGYLEQGEVDRIWRIRTKESSAWLSKVKDRTFCNFGDIGEVRVGVKTTADKVFIRSDWESIPKSETPEVLRPLTTHKIARRFKALHTNNNYRILYTHQIIKGRRVPIDLAKHPRTAKYLNHYREVLEARQYIRNAGREWYEIWVPHNPDIWARPKIVFRDITEKPVFWMDLSGSVVNGDCYWLTCRNPEQVDLLWIALAVGNSSLIEKFYDYRFHNKLYANRRRFMTQYVKQFPIPNPDSPISKKIISIVKKIYDLIPSTEAERLERLLDGLVWEAFGLSIKKGAR